MNRTNYGGIYVHIPFCVNKCNYCDFLSYGIRVFLNGKFGTRDEVVALYVDTLIREINLTNSDEQFDTIYIGGGTPSSIEEEYIGQIIKAIQSQFDFVSDTEITIECNPKTVTEESAKMYKQYGINRVSIGLQSTNDYELKKLGRIHNYEDFLQCYKYIKEAGIDNVSVDLMSAIPEQTVESYRENLQKIMELNPAHISSYSLIIEEGTPFYDMDKRGLLNLVSEDEEREMYYLTNRILADNGYERYEISNYSKPGFESRHNIKYWTGCSYLGFGLGASSMYKNTRYKNLDDLRKYVSMNNLCDIREDKIVLSEKDMMEEFMYLGLRIMDGVSKEDFFRRFNTSLEKIYSSQIDMLKTQNLVEEKGDMLRLTCKGIDVSNRVMSEFLLDI